VVGAEPGEVVLHEAFLQQSSTVLEQHVLSPLLGCDMIQLPSPARSLLPDYLGQVAELTELLVVLQQAQ